MTAKMFMMVLLMVGITICDQLEECACIAEEENFAINCGDKAAMTAAYDFLVSNGCGGSCEGECQKNFYIVLAHHDYCLSDEVPPVLEEAVHDFEQVCEDCFIRRKFDPSLPTCDTPDCGNQQVAEEAYNALVSENCGNNCTSASCGSNYRIIRGYHDLCSEDAIPIDIEKGIHDLETPCEAFGCNAVNESFEPECSASPALSWFWKEWF